MTFCDLTLTFSSMTFVLTQYPSKKYNSTLGDFELFVTHLPASRAQVVKTPYLDLWTPTLKTPYLDADLDLIRDINLEILKMD